MNKVITLREVGDLPAETKERPCPPLGAGGGKVEKDFQRKGQESSWTGFHPRHGARGQEGELVRVSSVPGITTPSFHVEM